MTQPSYRASEGHPMRRFAVFAAVLFVVVVIGSQPWNGGRSKRSVNSVCVCVASRASLIMRSMTGTLAMTKTQAHSQQKATDTATASSPRVASAI